MKNAVSSKFRFYSYLSSIKRRFLEILSHPIYIQRIFWGLRKKNRRSKEVKKPRDRLRHSRDDEKLFDFSNRIGQESSDTTQITRCEKQPSLLSAAAAAAALSPPSTPSPPSSPSTFFHLFAQGLKSFSHIPANGNSSLRR